MNYPYQVKESFTIKTEVLNLEFELKSFERVNPGNYLPNDTFKLSPVLVVKSGTHVCVRLILSSGEYETLKEEFQKKNSPEWNFFDNVISRVASVERETLIKKEKQ